MLLPAVLVVSQDCHDPDIIWQLKAAVACSRRKSPVGMVGLF